MSLRVLVVDDDAQNRELMEMVMVKYGFQVTTAIDADTAIEQLAAAEFHVVVTDKNMPGRDHENEGGMDVLRYVRDNYPEIQVIMITGYATIETAIEAMKLGAFDYLTKPFSVPALAAKVSRAAEYRQFINPQQMIENYKALQDEAFTLMVNRDKATAADKQHKLISAFNQKLDDIFRQVRCQEHFIVSQRDALAEIFSIAEQLQEILEPGSEPYLLAQRIVEEARQRL